MPIPTACDRIMELICNLLYLSLIPICSWKNVWKHRNPDRADLPGRTAVSYTHLLDTFISQLWSFGKTSLRSGDLRLCRNNACGISHRGGDFQHASGFRVQFFGVLRLGNNSEVQAFQIGQMCIRDSYSTVKS